MPSLKNFVRKTPASAFRTYLEHAAIDLPAPVDWDAEEPNVVRQLLSAIEQTTGEELDRMVKDIDRVTAMADEAGQTALLSIVEDRAGLELRANANDRALWLFVHEPVLFRREICVNVGDGV